MPAPTLLDADGRASTATAIMMSHHAFRRDLARFRHALSKLDVSRIAALREEWRHFHDALHGHHEAEDTGVFPALRNEHAALAPTLTKLTDDHHQIDPLLERGDRAFGELPRVDNATAVLDELAALLDPHLALEEADVIPFLRVAFAFTPENDEQATMYADGFAWSMHGIAADIIAKVEEMLPALLRNKIPAARAKFEARWQRVWGDVAETQSRTPVPG